MNDVPSRFEWFEQDEGRKSERCRRRSFEALFGPDGRPNGWLVALVLLAACVVGVSLGGA
ncbi:MAG TPA: hypothetical protein VIL30_24250 [Ramlibacter sp.]